MTKQEEIREGIKKLRPHGICSEAEWQLLTDIISQYLHSQGVVIKVDRELPPPSLQKDCWNCAYKELNPCPYRPRGLNHCKNFKNFKAGYGAVEPLIEGVSNG